MATLLHQAVEEQIAMLERILSIGIDIDAAGPQLDGSAPGRERIKATS
jgi:hypothetical protein